MEEAAGKIEAVVEDGVAWQNGRSDMWSCDAIVGPVMLSYLVDMAAYAPRALWEDFVAQFEAAE